MSAGWWIVFVKEVRENLRDRRALTMSLLYGPLLGPILFVAITSFAIGKQLDEAEKPIALPVVGAEYAPNLVEFLRQQGVEIKTPPADPEAAIRAQNEAIILRILPTFGGQWRDGVPARIELLLDDSRQHARSRIARVRSLLERYSSQIGRLRLQLRGIDPQLATALQLAERDLSTARSRAGALLGMLPYFLLLCAFLGGMYLAIDTTAGERERLSLEALLVNPVSPTQIMAGKLAAATAFALVSVINCIAAFVLGLPHVRGDEIGLQLLLTPLTALEIFALIAPVALLASAVQTIIASFAKTFREAQTYLQFLMLVPALPSVLLVLNPIKAVTWMYGVPLLSQSLLINELARGDTPASISLGLSIASTFAAAGVAAFIATRLFRGERLALAV